MQHLDVGGVLPAHPRGLEDLGHLALAAVLRDLGDDGEELRVVAGEPHEPGHLVGQLGEDVVLGRRSGVDRHHAPDQGSTRGGQREHV